ncbi:hypothetical protein OKW30_003875 [Paraburkholderia sp. Clong3]|uniref:DUF2844 domain-containing protein n=1 Tax=unclassified Paraburkholderia TaxID=2615204 RepID=UPI00161B33C7|nr:MULTISPECIES: DUF2844 domain-containing protein [unclassified Paraburkholderia]MBC8736838.1 DUF2844 domain-containing protein [Paraburkholderia sp. UCT31]
MWSRIGRAGVTALVLPCSLLALTAAQSAHAALGSAPLTPPSDASVSSRVVQPASGTSQSVMRSESSAASSTSSIPASYTVRETTFGNGTVVREYLSTSGAVFGISWHGPQMPDLSDLLGSYFPQYVAGVKAARAARGNARGPVAVDESGLVVRSGGHMGAFSGVAWLPSALPAGVSGSDIQ